MKRGTQHKYQHLLKALQAYRNRQHQYNWLEHARSNQKIPEGAWQTWLILAGRGFGKTRTGAETIRQWAVSGVYRRIALVASSIQEVRSVMIEGESGLLAVHPRHERPQYQPSKRRLIWPNGAVATFYGGETYEQLRGPQFDAVWVDELAKFRAHEALWQQLQLCLRLGENPRAIITTTPRTLAFLQRLIQDPTVHVTRGTTFENAQNLSPTYLAQMQRQYHNTRLGAQELYAEILTETQGALWQRRMLQYQEAPFDEVGQYNLERIVIAIDPATTHHDKSDETGIIVVGLDAQKRAYVLEDMSGRWSPNDWGQRVAEAYWRYRADRVVAEVNKGGDLVERVLKAVDPAISYKAVRATRGKYTRAEPIAALYEQGRVFHHRPFSDLETQMCDYVPNITHKSPDRMDALVWGLTELMLVAESRPMLKVWGSC